jgi:hypothetical protein
MGGNRILEKLDNIEPETKQISYAVFKAQVYAVLTIKELVEHGTEYTDKQLREQLKESYQKIKNLQGGSI